MSTFGGKNKSMVGFKLNYCQIVEQCLEPLPSTPVQHRKWEFVNFFNTRKLSNRQQRDAGIGQKIAI